MLLHQVPFKNYLETIKKGLCFILACLMLCEVASAGSLFPSANEAFGKAMPSLSSVVNHGPDEETENTEGLLCTYRGFTIQNYEAFRQYLSGTNCEIKTIEVQDRIITADITDEDGEMIFVYDYKSKIASIQYKNNSRPEDKAKSNEQGEKGLLPPAMDTFGVAMPSLNPFVKQNPKEETLEDHRIKLTYDNVTERIYQQFSVYLSQYSGCSLIDKSAKNGIVQAKVQCGEDCFEFRFDYQKYQAVIIYPEMSYIEDKQAEEGEDVSGLLPDMDQELGTLMPRIETVIGTGEYTGTRLTDGTYVLTYDHFTDNEYKQFSALLKKYECTVEGYTTDENGVLTIQISRKGDSFTFVYDRASSTAVVKYPKECRIEPVPTAIPVVAAATPKPEAEHYYSEDACWYTAYEYFKGLSWKNPKSLTVHGHTSSFNNGSYSFTIDYSAQNGFGGYNRTTAIIIVNAKTNTISYAFVE